VVYNELNKFLNGRGITITRNLIGPTSPRRDGRLLDHAAEA
jgi:hypothetical protein